MTVAYLGHPLGETNGHSAVQRASNLANAIDWVRFLNEATKWSIICPWHLNAIAIGEDSHGPRRMMTELEVLERSDIYVAAGGNMAPHMLTEVRRAKRHGIPILDLSNLGVTPPSIGEEHWQLLKDMANRASANRPRRVWMPLLSGPDIASLKAARHALYIDTLENHDSAVEILDRVIQAAALAP